MGAFWEEKKVRTVELQQFGSLRGVKCHFLNIGVKVQMGE
jgi:hypothetical protein